MPHGPAFSCGFSRASIEQAKHGVVRGIAGSSAPGVGGLWGRTWSRGAWAFCPLDFLVTSQGVSSYLKPRSFEIVYMIKPTGFCGWSGKGLKLVEKWTRSCACSGQQDFAILPATLTSDLALFPSPPADPHTHKVTLGCPRLFACRFLLVLGFPWLALSRDGSVEGDANNAHGAEKLLREHRNHGPVFSTRL